MRVAFDAGPGLGPPTGIGRYSSELADALRQRSVDLVPYAISWRAPGRAGVRRWRVPAAVMYSWWSHVPRPRLEALVGDVDVVHATNFMLPPPGRAAGVVTIHDMSFHRDDVGASIARLRKLVPVSVARAERIVAPTAAVAGEIEAAYPGAGAKISITHEGVAPHFFGATPLSGGALAGLGVAPPFVLAVGTRQPRKNLARLVQAWEQARSDLPGWSLVIAGPKGWGPDVVATPDVVVTGPVADETLPGLVAAAALFCYPSLYEGFGLPPLEAMAAGTPVVCGAYPAAAEVLGDAALLVAPTDVDAIAAGLIELGRDESARSTLARRGRACAARYTWAGCAAATLAAYEAASGEARRKPAAGR